MSVKEASKLLGIDYDTMRILLQNGKFGIAVKRKTNYFYLVNEREVREWLRKS